MARTYALKKRAERQEQTHRRIVEAAVALHGTVGPAKTTISALAALAGVERLTVYRHFPDETALYAACSAHWLATHPAPEPEAWRAISSPEARLRRALTEVFAFYRDGEQMIANALRDAPEIPALAAVNAPLHDLLARQHALLAEPWPAAADRRPLVRAALGHALDFAAWRSLARGQGLADDRIVELMAGMVRCAAEERTPPQAPA